MENPGYSQGKEEYNNKLNNLFTNINKILFGNFPEWLYEVIDNNASKPS